MSSTPSLTVAPGMSNSSSFTRGGRRSATCASSSGRRGHVGMGPRGPAPGDEHAEVGPISTAVGQHVLGLEDRRQRCRHRRNAPGEVADGRAAETRQSDSNADHLRSRAGCGHPTASRSRPDYQVGKTSSRRRRDALLDRCAQATEEAVMVDAASNERSRRSTPVLWACQDLNLGPHPYQAYSRDGFKLAERGDDQVIGGVQLTVVVRCIP
jgi:hypothetical protein